MVANDLSIASEMTEALERAKIKVSVALWAYMPEYEDWRFVVAAREFDSPGKLYGYQRLQEALEAGGFPANKVPTVMVLRTSDPFVKDLRRRHGKTKSADGERIRTQLFGDRWVEDGYAYRIA